MKMDPDKKQIWLEALRSNTYVQAQGSFSVKNGEGVVEHCCLAVLAHEAAKHNAPGIRWLGDADEPEVVAVYSIHEGWNQVRDHIDEVMQRYPEVEWKTPEANLPTECWGWAPASEFNEGLLPACVQNWAGIDADNPYLQSGLGERQQASSWNDVAKANFVEIANLVEESL